MWVGGGLTGFDDEGHSVTAKLVGGIAEDGEVRRDLDTDHTLNTCFCWFFGRRLKDLKTQSSRKSLVNQQERFPCHPMQLSQ